MSFLAGSLSRRLSVVFAVLLLACCGASIWLQMQANGRYEQEVTQRLSRGLAAHIAENSTLMERDGLNPVAVRELFDKLMAVNPSVEVYLLSPDGRIQAQAAPPGHLKRDRVDLAPIRRLLEGAPLPIVDDDPRSGSARKVFSVAPLRIDGPRSAMSMWCCRARSAMRFWPMPRPAMSCARRWCRWPWWPCWA